MLFIGEKVGARAPEGLEYPAIDIAVDPLEGTNLCATGAPNSIAVLAASEAGGLLHAPDCYMDKIIAGPACPDGFVEGGSSGSRPRWGPAIPMMTMPNATPRPRLPTMLTTMAGTFSRPPGTAYNPTDSTTTTTPATAR